MRLAGKEGESQEGGGGPSSSSPATATAQKPSCAVGREKEEDSLLLLLSFLPYIKLSSPVSLLFRSGEMSCLRPIFALLSPLQNRVREDPANLFFPCAKTRETLRGESKKELGVERESSYRSGDGGGGSQKERAELGCFCSPWVRWLGLDRVFPSAGGGARLGLPPPRQGRGNEKGAAVAEK